MCIISHLFRNIIIDVMLNYIPNNTDIKRLTFAFCEVLSGVKEERTVAFQSNNILIYSLVSVMESEWHLSTKKVNLFFAIRISSGIMVNALRAAL